MKQQAWSLGAVPISRRRMLRGAAGVLGVGAVALLTGCARPSKPELVPSDDEVKAAVTVWVVDNAYEPATVEVAAGTAVRWVFDGTMEHDVVAEDGSFVSELVTGGSYTHLFTEAGEFPYDCSIHPEMTGMVKVVAP
ncbi:plastocyanin [Leucobacter exalbidus]|uniref:Plastocyanin n=1 Tax=Leucobacter exalbidus TaxID=662960 RepID=A0A940PN21_9MICO|nr:cupredoxin domain-containing protein [Leucobacter exalbidus]MBP1326183.1 plastocyanin [Leucobacter exalbidus]